ncbi:DUF926-domain-containing protein [Microstroma glucosiphilum]|uniref:DUF926-domain-containing protein n=1 Tax=Pseudomicrostroma glucosiphilum TaxID=1684307 RepID=A0A316UAT4_9BASI|nr:DUF926-domain-containing protein [Pseudomicrostroma glucosiphilum]PWN22330.1 DUF926-domain-containing protein [Pseudomicrostroma glucosiphilum]
MTSSQHMGSPPPPHSNGEDRERMLRDRLMKARGEAERTSSSGNGKRASPSPSAYRGDYSQGREHDRYPRRPSPTYDSYRGNAYTAPGPPPRRDDYERYPASRQEDYHQRPPPPHWDRQPPRGDRPYDDRPPIPYHQSYPREEYGAPPPGVWGRRGPREERGGEGGEGVAPRHAPGGSYGPSAGGGDFFSSRNEQRKHSTLSIWPPSPKSPYRSDSDDGGRKRKKSKSKHSSSRSKRDKSSHRSHRRHSSHKRRYEDSEEDSDSEYERERRRRRREKERRRDGDRSEGRDRERRHRASRSQDPRNSDEERKTEGAERSGSRDRQIRRRRRSRSRSTSRSSSEEAEAKRGPTVTSNAHGLQVGEAAKLAQDASDDDEIGPKLPLTADGKVVDPRAYGGALLPGEGSAMAAFLQEGQRIPRRGEIGLSSDQIEDYEKVGYVMSGSRHARMNAVRMRKENQVISAEEKRTLLKMRNEEKEKKEREIVGQFRELLDTMQPGGH